ITWRYRVRMRTASSGLCGRPESSSWTKHTSSFSTRPLYALVSRLARSVDKSAACADVGLLKRNVRLAYDAFVANPVGVPDSLNPLGRAAHRLELELLQTLNERRRIERHPCLFVEPLNDLAWCSLRHEQAHPTAAVVAVETLLGQRRHLGQRSQAFGRG